MGHDQLEDRRREPRRAAGARHALHAAAPRLDQSERVEHPADDPIAKLRDPARQVHDGESEGQEPGVLDLQAVVEDGDAQRGATLRVVGMRDRVDDGFTDRHRRQGPALAAAHRADLGPVEPVLLDEGDCLLDRAHRLGPNLDAVVDAAAVGAPEPSGLDPGVGEVPFAIPAEEDDSAGGGHLAPLVIRHQAQRREIAPGDPSNGCKRLGSGPEVQRFRVEVRHRLFVEGYAARVAAQCARIRASAEAGALLRSQTAPSSQA
jgi:hypothetical protein